MLSVGAELATNDENRLIQAIRNGAQGYLLKDLRPDQLFDMLRSVMKGETPISPAVAGMLLSEIRNGTLTTVDAPKAISVATTGPTSGMTFRSPPFVEAVLRIWPSATIVYDGPKRCTDCSTSSADLDRSR